MIKNTPSLKSLTGSLLVAMPGLEDPRFARSVVAMCAHSQSGAMGLIINKPAEGIEFDDLMSQLDLETVTDHALEVHFGGPVEPGQGFVLHSDDYAHQETTLALCDGVRMTATLDILRDVGAGQGPDRAWLALGYAGWGPGQLEQELRGNGWLTTPAWSGLFFDIAPEERWEAAMAAIGVDLATLSAHGGRA